MGLIQGLTGIDYLGTVVLAVTSRTRERKGLVAGSQLGMVSGSHPEASCYGTQL